MIIVFTELLERFQVTLSSILIEVKTVVHICLFSTTHSTWHLSPDPSWTCCACPEIYNVTEEGAAFEGFCTYVIAHSQSVSYEWWVLWVRFIWGSSGTIWRLVTNTSKSDVFHRHLSFSRMCFKQHMFWTSHITTRTVSNFRRQIVVSSPTIHWCRVWRVRLNVGVCVCVFWEGLPIEINCLLKSFCVLVLSRTTLFVSALVSLASSSGEHQISVIISVRDL